MIAWLGPKNRTHFTRAATCFGVAVLLWLLNTGLAEAQPPPPPHAFFGEVTINGQPAPAGTVIEGRAEGIRLGIPGNPITTTVAGRYGGPLLQEAKLVVQGRVADGLALEFYVNGARAACAPLGGTWQDTFPFQASGLTPLNLRVGDEEPALDAASPTLTPTPQQQAALEPAVPEPTASATLRPAGEATYRTATPETPHAAPAGTVAAPPTGPPTSSAATPLPQVETAPLPGATIESPVGMGNSTAFAEQPSPPAQAASTTAVPLVTAQAMPPPADAVPPPTAQAIAAAPRPSSTPLLQSMRLTAPSVTPVARAAQPTRDAAYLPALAIGSLLSAAAIAAVTLLLRRMQMGK